MTEELPLCECGCGERVTKKRNRFIHNHHKRRDTYWKTQQEPQLCGCGCGELAESGNRFIWGHHMRGVPKTPKQIAAVKKGRRNSDVVKAMYDAKRGVPLSPEHCAAITKGKTGVPHSPEHSYAITKGLQESDAVKANADKMRGGNDLVIHHYIYDESDLSLNTIQMTRSDHMKLHMILRKLNYIVPHINSSDEPVKETRDEVLL